MPYTHEIPNPESPAHRINIARFSLQDLQEKRPIYESLLQSYCDVFNAPPWNEEWNRDSAAQVVEVGLADQSEASLAMEGDRVLGFFWGREGTADEIVAKAVHTYLASDLDSYGRQVYPENDRIEMVRAITERLADGGYPDLLFYGMEEGVLPEFRSTFKGARIAYELMKAGTTLQLSEGSAEWMFGMTSEKSPMYSIFNKGYRKAHPLYGVRELKSSVEGIDHTDNPLVFMMKNMHEFFRRPSK